MNSKILFVSSAILLSLTLVSCSQGTEVTLEPNRSEIRSSQSIRDLTRQLREYDSQFTYDNTENLQPVTRLPKITYSKGDIVKIAISDVKGGLRGVGGGAGGVIVGAATSSLIKFGTITVKKLLWGYIKDNYLRPKVYRSNSTCQYADSIGYYHNELEYAMYDSDRSSADKPSLDLIAAANARLITMSTGFSKDGGLTVAEQLSIASDVDAIKNTDVTLPEGITSIGEGAFRGNGKLRCINIPSSVTNIGEDAYYGCTYAAGSVTVPEGVSRLAASTFENCSSLTEVRLPSTLSTMDTRSLRLQPNYLAGGWHVNFKINRMAPPKSLNDESG